MDTIKNSMTTREAAAYLGLEETTLRKARVSGDSAGRCPCPPYLKLGRSVRYLKRDLDAWVEQFRVDPAKLNNT